MLVDVEQNQEQSQCGQCMKTTNESYNEKTLGFNCGAQQKKREKTNKKLCLSSTEPDLSAY